MLLQPAVELPEGERWLYELKLDGYRAVAFKTGGRAHLRSRNDNDFQPRYPAVAKALADLPDDTVVDGELVALDGSGHPSFNELQNHGSHARIIYFVFDLMMLRGRDVMGETLETRRGLLQKDVLPTLYDPIRISPELQVRIAELIESVRAQSFEGLVAKRKDSHYEPGQRSGAWLKMRVNRLAEFVIGGYTVGGRTFDALILGHYENGRLMYVARTRSGFTPLIREQLFRGFRELETAVCPFANLPEKQAGRWGQGLTATKMIGCRWLKPVLKGQCEYLEWTQDNHLRHSRFVRLCEP
jgi:bifunctional non-homologous end joining protein LigD